tara:strand:+ start:65 stop:514 length:450 start_codon:yes stop_codon:yes gene_type:complete
MIRLDLDLDPELVEVAWHMIQDSIGVLQNEPSSRFTAPDEDDPDLVEAWEDGLREDLDVDIQAMEQLFVKNRLGEESIELKPDIAERVLRACSAVRLRLRTKNMVDLPDTALELGDVAMEQMDPEVRVAYFTYGLLAYIQEELVALLDG